MKCKFCKCTDERACANGCYWVTKNICSECWPDCADKLGVAPLCKEGRCRRRAALKTLDRIGPRWYALFVCAGNHKRKIRINPK